MLPRSTNYRMLVALGVGLALWALKTQWHTTGLGITDVPEGNWLDLLLARKYLSPPSVLPYSLVNAGGDPSRGQGRYVRKLLNEMKNGFFVEAGGYDGETFSNTLYLEKNMNWTGLLVEGDPRLYAQLVSKHRKSWTSPACLATQATAHRMNYTTYKDFAMWGGLSADNNGAPSLSTRKVVEVQCIPLHILLKAIGVTTVDYFSLDVEGSELKVLKTIPFDKLLIKAISIEYKFLHGPNTGVNGVQSLLEFFSDKDYQLVGISPSHVSEDHDVIFVHKTIISNRSSW